MRIGRPSVDLADDAIQFPTIIHALDFAADKMPKRISLVCEKENIDFEHYRYAVAGMAKMILEICRPGDRVAVLMTNSIDMAVTLMGCMAAGTQTAPLNPSLTERELLPLLSDIDAQALMCDFQNKKQAHQLASKAGIKMVYTSNDEFDIWKK